MNLIFPKLDSSTFQESTKNLSTTIYLPHKSENSIHQQLIKRTIIFQFTNQKSNQLLPQISNISNKTTNNSSSVSTRKLPSQSAQEKETRRASSEEEAFPESPTKGANIQNSWSKSKNKHSVFNGIKAKEYLRATREERRV